MRLLRLFLLGMIMLAATSCYTSGEMSDEIYSDTPSVEFITNYGTPYYYNGAVIYYVWRDHYYYLDNSPYGYHRYRRPIPPRPGKPRYQPKYHHHVGPATRPSRPRMDDKRPSRPSGQRPPSNRPRGGGNRNPNGPTRR